MVLQILKIYYMISYSIAREARKIQFMWKPKQISNESETDFCGFGFNQIVYASRIPPRPTGGLSCEEMKIEKQ